MHTRVSQLQYAERAARANLEEAIQARVEGVNILASLLIEEETGAPAFPIGSTFALKDPSRYLKRVIGYGLIDDGEPCYRCLPVESVDESTPTHRGYHYSIRPHEIATRDDD